MRGEQRNPSQASETNDVTASSTIRVPCPGRAHARGEPCLICDEDKDGTISVIVTEVELSALAGAAQGRRVDVSLEPRLRALGLLEDVAGCWLPTPRGYALLGGSKQAN